MSEVKFRQFMNGFAAAAQLLQRAGENGFFVEYVCLAASIIDGSLRIGLILQHQLKTVSSEVLEDLLRQSDEDPIISERRIYRCALEAEVISKDLFDRLGSLYAKRNRVVHRYIVSELTTKGVLEIASEFEQVLPLIHHAVGELEARQVEAGVGMSRDGTFPGLSRRIGAMITEKHGSRRLARLLSGGGT